MPGLDALPADQRTVLQLVLRQGRSYDEIARALRLDPAAVRERAHAGLAGLVPPDGVPEDDRGRIGDWLLGQRGDGAGEALAQDGPARRWASALRDELEPVAAGALPPLPEVAASAGPAGAATPPPAAAAPATDAPRPASRRGGVVLLAALALFTVIVAVVVGLVVSGGDTTTKGTSAASTSTPTTGSASTSSAAANTRVVAQVNLSPPKGAPAPRALGVVQVVALQGKQAINAIAQGLPAPTKQAGFGIWLLGDGGRRTWLGYFRNADQQGRLVAQGQLDKRLDVASYKRVLITRETAEPPKRPGTTYLAGPVNTDGQGSTGTGQSSGSSGTG